MSQSTPTPTLSELRASFQSSIDAYEAAAIAGNAVEMRRLYATGAELGQQIIALENTLAAESSINRDIERSAHARQRQKERIDSLSALRDVADHLKHSYAKLLDTEMARCELKRAVQQDQSELLALARRVLGGREWDQFEVRFSMYPPPCNLETGQKGPHCADTSQPIEYWRTAAESLKTAYIRDCASQLAYSLEIVPLSELDSQPEKSAA